MTSQGTVYLVKVQQDAQLLYLEKQLGVRLYDTRSLEQEKKKMEQQGRTISGKQTLAQAKENYECYKSFVQKLFSMKPSFSEVIVESQNFGTVTLLKVRETFQSPIYCVLYTIFVLSACFHAFNGLWSFVLSWGLIIRFSAQRAMLPWVVILMGLISALGLMAIWGG